MRRFLLCFAAVAGGAVAALAQAPAPPPELPPLTIKLTLRPAAEPRPALQFQLLPEASELTSGNAALAYYRAFSPEWAVVPYRHSQIRGELMELAGKRLRDLPPKAEWGPNLPFLGEGQLRELRRAARMTHCDWDLLARLKEGGLATMLPDIQAIREFGNVLALRARAAMLEKKPLEALELLKLQFTLARHLGEAPALIHALYGSAVAAQAVEVLEDLIEQPNSPNLYWALTALPDPLIDWRQALQSERFMLDWMFPDAEQIQGSAYTPEQFNVFVDKLQERLTRSNMLNPNERAVFRPGLALIVATAYPEAKRALIAAGRSAAEVEAMPTAQVVFIQFLTAQRLRFDDFMKWTYLPYRLAEPHLLAAARDVETVLLPALNRSLGHPTVLLRFLALKANLQRRVAALRCVEAIRLHAAANDGALPDSLDQIKLVPVPPDPALGQPFSYRRTPAGFELRAGPYQHPDNRTLDGSLLYQVSFGN